MQTLAHRLFISSPPGGLFDDAAVRGLFPDHSPGARRLLVHRAVESGEVLRLKPGCYCLAAAYRRSHPHPFTLAAVLCSPSHVSLESALAFHGLIPEAVQVVSSVTHLRSRSFTTPLGHFSFTRVPAREPSRGVEARQVGEGLWAFIASPLRAIADLLYLRKEAVWEQGGPAFLTDSLRIDTSDLAAIDWADAPALAASLPHARVKTYLLRLAETMARRRAKRHR